MRQATVWEPPDDSTMTGVANVVMRELHPKAPNVFHYDSESANRGRINAARTSHDRAVARRQERAKRASAPA